MLIDTHSHVYASAFENDINEVIQRAQQESVQQILLPNIDLESIPGMLQLMQQHPSLFKGMMGLHPCDVKENYKEVLTEMRPLFSEHPFVAVGEIGIDLYWDKSTLPLQIAAFEQQIEWAKELQLPIVIHARDSFQEIFEVLDSVGTKGLSGVFHCFTGTLAEVEKITSYPDFYFGIGGVLTFKKSGLDAVVPHIPKELLVVETDAPYLAPTPYRGKRNEPAYVKLVAQKLADVLAMPLTELAELTTKNATKLFEL